MTLAASTKRRAEKIISKLRMEYPEAKTSLVFLNPFELLVATILSAQCTDERVNMVTVSLFKKYPGPREMAEAPLDELRKLIKSTGFFRSKTLALVESSKAIVERHNGHVPRTMAELTKLRGVGRKTANVVLGNAFGVPGLPVDTHVKRVSFRLGFTKEVEPTRIERDLMRILPEQEWVEASHLLIFHGRKICTARRARCEVCPVSPDCPRNGVSTSPRS